MRKVRPFTPDEDSPLLTAWYRGDIAAFETLIWKYQKRIFNLALLITGDERAATTITTNSFLAAHENIRSLKSTTRFYAWLVRIALKECRELNDYRARDADSPPDQRPLSAGEASAANDFQLKLQACIRELPVELAENILLHHVRGYSLETMEEILQINGEFLLSRLFEAEDTLISCLKNAANRPEHQEKSAAPHPEIRRTFSAYLDNSIEGNEKELTRAHLKSCGSCREALADLEWMIEHLKSLPDVEPPHWLAASIMRKAKTAPGRRSATTTPSHLRLKITFVLLSGIIIGLLTYLLLAPPEATIDLPRTGNVPPLATSGKGGVEEAPTFTSVIKGIFRGAIGRPDAAPKPESVAKITPPLPEAVPIEPSLPLTPATLPAQPAPTVKTETAQKKERVESVPHLPQEWGETPAPTRSQPKKSTPARSRGAEIAVVLETADPTGVGRDIESAVTAMGGTINGRAFSNGSDILYTRIDADRVFDLMGKLAKVGRLKELPQLPDEVEGPVDLVIRW